MDHRRVPPDAVRGLLTLLVFGAVFLWYGIITPFVWWLSMVGIMLLAIGLAIAYVVVNSATQDRIEFRHQTLSATQSPMIIEREVVKVRCRYCRMLNETTDSSCSSCGARL